MKIYNTFSGILLTFLLLVSCVSETIKYVDMPLSENNDTIAFPFVVDTFLFESLNKELLERSYSNYRPLYFGKKSDTLYADYNLVSFAFSKSTIFEVSLDEETIKQEKKSIDLFNKKRANYLAYYKELNYHSDSIPISWEEAKIKILLDTTQLIYNVGRTKGKGDEFVYNAYPVILENISETEIKIGYGSHIPLILEIKDKNGDWKEVEYPFTYPCGNGLPSITLPKHELVLTSVAVLKVEEGTKMRLKIGKNYSEAF